MKLIELEDECIIYNGVKYTKDQWELKLKQDKKK